MAENKRESRKQELRERVVSTEELRQQERISRKRRGRRGFRFLLLLVPVLIILLLLHWASHRELKLIHKGWVLESYGELGLQSDYESYYPYADGMLRVTRDGAYYINSAGKSVWNQSFEMGSPYVSISGGFAAIADRGRSSVYIMNTSGSTGQAETGLPISKISVSEKGVTYVLMEDSEASYITVLSKEGSNLDITIKSILEGDGYPLDIAVSPDGTELICSFAYLENSVLQNKLVFYNLSEVGQSVGSNRVVGGFSEDFRGHLSTRVRFSGNDAAQAFYDSGVAFFSTKVLTSPELIRKTETGEVIRSIASSGDYVGIITELNEEGSTESYRLQLFKSNGQKCYEKAFSFRYKDFSIDDGHVLLSRDRELMILDKKGRTRYNGELENPISGIKLVSDNLLGMGMMVSSSGRIEQIRLR